MNTEIVDRLTRSFPSVEAFILQNRMNEREMATGAANEVVNQMGRIREQLLAAGLDPPQKAALSAEWQALGARLEMLNRLANDLRIEIETLSGGEAKEPMQAAKRLEAKPAASVGWLIANRTAERDALQSSLREQVELVDQIKAAGREVPEGEIAELARRRMLFDEVDHGRFLLEGIGELVDTDFVRIWNERGDAEAKRGASPPVAFPASAKKSKKGR